MKSTIATILGTVAVGLIKDKLGSMSESKKLSYKEFDAYEFCPTIWFNSPKVNHYVNVQIDGILAVSLKPGNDLDGVGDRMFVASVVIDPQGPLADWRTNVRTRIHLNRISDDNEILEHSLKEKIMEKANTNRVYFEWNALGDDTGVSFISEDWKPYELEERVRYYEGTAEMGFKKEKLLTWGDGTPFFNTKKTRIPKLRTR